MMNNHPSAGWSLRKGMMLSFGLSLFLVFLLTQIMIIFGVPLTPFKGLSTVLKEKAFADISQRADNGRRELESWVLGHKADAKAMATAPLLISALEDLRHRQEAPDTDKHTEIHRQLRAFVMMIKESHLPGYSKVELISPEKGNILFSTRPEEEGRNTAHCRYFQKALNPLAEDVVEKEIHADGKGISLIFARPVHCPDPQGRPVVHAVLALHYPMTNLQSLLHEHIGRSGEIVLLDEDLHLLSPLRYSLPDGSSPNPLDFVFSTKPAQLAVQGIETVVQARDYRGVDVLAATRHLQITTEMAWGLVVKIDTDEIFHPIRQTIITHALALIGALLAGGLLIMLIATRLTRPIFKMSQAAAAIMEGDLSVRTLPMGSREMRELSRSFNLMLARLENWNKDLSAAVENRTSQLADSEARFRTLVDNAPEGIFVQSQGRILFINPAMARFLLAGRPEDLIGTEIMPRVAPEYHDAVLTRIRFQCETGKSVPPMDQEYLRLDGSRLPVETTAVPIRFQGRDAHLVFVRDITDRRKMQSEKEKLKTQLVQSQKMESIGRLAGGVAHDFNNMLMAIIGNTELALDDADPASSISSKLQEVLVCAKRSADLTRQLLAFARKQTISPRLLDLNELVQSMIKMLQRLIGENIHLVWKPGVDIWMIKMDPSQVDQILVNLAVNARDAIAGVGSLIIATENAALDETYCLSHAECLPGEYVLLTVSDTGAGMDKETLSHLFEPFYTTKEVGQGTGLGLATIYGIVRQNNSFINVYSEPGQGTTFKIYIPRTVLKHVKEVRESKGKPSRGTETILLVEDEQSILSVSKTMLERFGYTVLDAATPTEAQILAEQHPAPIHLLITDVVMPHMNGKDLMEAVTVFRPDIKVLFMSGYAADIIAHHGVLEPGVPFIQKPFSMLALAERIREVLEKQL